MTLDELKPFAIDKRERLGRDYECGRLTHHEFEAESRELAREQRLERAAARAKRSAAR